LKSQDLKRKIGLSNQTWKCNLKYITAGAVTIEPIDNDNRNERTDTLIHRLLRLHFCSDDICSKTISPIGECFKIRLGANVIKLFTAVSYDFSY
jgi:hypothetical protein